MRASFSFGANAMSEAVEDLRILSLAQMYEDAYERFVHDVAMRDADPATRKRLAALTSPQDRHGELLRAHADRIRGTLSPDEGPEVVTSAIADVVEVERAAREFYLQHIDRIHDPALARLFRALAHEEELHVEIAERALDDYRRRHRLLGKPVAPPNDEPVLLLEWTGDYGPSPSS